MSTQVLYHAFGVVGYRHVRMEIRGNTLAFVLKKPRRKLRCAACGSIHVYKAGKQTWRELKTVPVGGKPIVLAVPRQRVFCLECDKTLLDPCPLVDGKRHYTRRLEQYSVQLCRVMTISDVAKHLGLHWNTIKDMEKRHLQARFDPPRLRDLKHIAIDEIAIRKGHEYKTIVLDLDSGRIVHVGDGKGADALEDFFCRIRRARTQLSAIAMDMSGGYLSAVRRFKPGTPIVFDRFHVIKLVNDKIDKLRRAHVRDCEKANRKFVKGVRYLLLMSSETLEKHEARQPGSKKRLSLALALNEPLNKAYYLKEKIRSIWDQTTRQQGDKVLRECVAEAMTSTVSILGKLGKTLLRYAEGILAHFDHKITCGPLEGINNKIKVLKRKAYGYRDDEFFRLKLLGLHESRYAFVG